MRELVGWIHLRGTPAAPGEALSAMRARLTVAGDAVASRARGRAFEAATAGRPGPERVYADDARMLIAVGPGWAPAGGDGAADDADDAAPSLLDAVARRGPAALDAVTGAGAAALAWDGGRRALLAVDRMGIAPLYWARAGDLLVFGSRPTAVAAHPAVAAAPDPGALLHYLYYHMVPAPRSAWRGVQRLQPGSCLLVDAAEPRVLRWWSPRFSNETGRLDFGPARDALREAVRAGVGRAAGRADGAVGCFLSGGTDSSTVAGMLGEVTGEPARTYSIGFDAAGFDEMEYARVTARHFGTRHHEHYVTPRDIVDALPRIAEHYGDPFGNSSVVPSYCCARLAAADGVGLLLGGDGGDELFGGNARYAQQLLLGHYDRVPALVRRALLEPALARFPAGERIALVRKARSYVAQASVALPERLESYNLLLRLGFERVLAPEFLAAVDPGAPLATLAGAWRRAEARTALNRMLALDLELTLADNDLPKVSGACALAGVDAAYPLLEPEVVALACALPVRAKVRGRRLRPFFKDALDGFLPREVLEKRKHGFGLPFGPWLGADPALRDLAFDAVRGLAARGIVRPDFVDRLLGELLAEHAIYYSSMVWVLMMLELWFRSHVDGAHGARAGAGPEDEGEQR